MKKAKGKNSSRPLLSKRSILAKMVAVLILFGITSARAIAAPQQNDPKKIKVTGVVVDESGMEMPSVIISIVGSPMKTVADFDGNFTLEVAPNATLEFTYMGFRPKRVQVKGQTKLRVTMSEDTKAIEEVVVVGYGQQKKASVVGSIAQVKGEDLKRTGGVTNVSQALTGLLPGVTTIQSTGRPGDDNTAITIRAVTSWNNSSPLVLVDGVERSMNDIDVNEIETISVLKDASATAIYGVRGAEGVILITTKKGQEGAPQFTFSVDMVFKFLADMAEKMDSYDTYLYQNSALERELPLTTKSQFANYYMPLSRAKRYRYYESPSDMYRFPNVDWMDVMTKDFALTQRYSLQVSGGTKFVKYFASMAYINEGDITSSGGDYGLDERSKYTYDRYNFRTNFDFQLTPTTTFTARTAGVIGIKGGTTTGNGYDIGYAFYNFSPANFPVVHEPDAAGNVVFGYYQPNPDLKNPMALMNANGINKVYSSQIATDFVLNQDLGFITKGLSARASFSFDTRMNSQKATTYGSLRSKYINPISGDVSWAPQRGKNEYDYVYTPGSYGSEYNTVWDTYRQINYQVQANYSREFGRHAVTAMGVMQRQERATGSAFPNYREEWAARATYSYADRYLFEANGAYNGSEKYARKYRFGFFPSFGIGWNITEEPILRNIPGLTDVWLNKLKVRYSWGKVGSDDAGERWGYMTNWGSGGRATFGNYISGLSPYLQYGEGTVGNPDMQWEETTKQNLGIEMALYKNRFTVNLDLFKETRDKVFISANQRSVPSYYGSTPVSANLGKTEAHGFELETKYTQTIGKEFSFFLGWNWTFAKDKIIFKDDPALLPAYRKEAGFQIGQTTCTVDNGMIKNWDDAYAAPSNVSGQAERLPGDYASLDYDGNGIIDNYDTVPYGFPQRPQFTYNMMGGFDWKGFSFMIQFYGVYNSTVRFDYAQQLGKSDPPIASVDMGDYWSVDNPTGKYTQPRANSEGNKGTLGLFDGSYLRLKNVELSYTYRGRYLKPLGLKSAKILVSGNNLCFWSEYPEDRERYINNVGGEDNLYPNVKRVNVGVNITF